MKRLFCLMMLSIVLLAGCAAGTKSAADVADKGDLEIVYSGGTEMYSLERSAGVGNITDDGTAAV